MSGTGISGAEPTPPPSESAADQRYFQAIEETFIRLRGAPLLLSPADWRTAKEWRRSGIPLALVQETLEEVFRRRRQRGADDLVSLRYCKRAVEKAWKEGQELAATARRAPAEALELQPLLAALAAALPEDLPRRQEVGERILAVDSEVQGDPEAAEKALSRLEEELLETWERALDPSRKAALAESESAALAALARRLPADEIEAARTRLHRQLLREELALPVLSIFSV